MPPVPEEIERHEDEHRRIDDFGSSRRNERPKPKCVFKGRAPIAGAKNVKVTLVYKRTRPSAPGKRIKGLLVEYVPGVYSPTHRHAKSAIIYVTVLEGEMRSQVNDGPVKVFRKGENWTEMPGDHHRVSANASKTRSAKILPVFVVDDDDAELTIPDEN